VLSYKKFTAAIIFSSLIAHTVPVSASPTLSALSDTQFNVLLKLAPRLSPQAWSPL
jgi:hypothetical protein